MHYLFYCQYGPQKDSGVPDYRPYPDVDTAIFIKSAAKAMSLMDDANLVMERIKSSQSFSNDLMSAAQQAKQTEVERLIRSTGIKKPPKITYNPDGITLDFQEDFEGKECCHIILKLRWL
ncbi:MAG TPA: hypothetical protein DCR24_03845 [Bacillus bacterium]|nr:hypothetical protein [Bacillus sp. (in: firmicutes)]